jgi:hypothetical protein
VRSAALRAAKRTRCRACSRAGGNLVGAVVFIGAG